MSVVNLTFVRATSVAGTSYAPAATLDVEVGLAAELVGLGRANYTTPPTQYPELSPSVNINAAQIVDSGAKGRQVLQAATFDAAIAALGITLGAADSGGTGYKALRVTNATT